MYVSVCSHRICKVLSNLYKFSHAAVSFDQMAAMWRSQTTDKEQLRKYYSVYVTNLESYCLIYRFD